MTTEQIETAALSLRVLARKNGRFTRDNAWDCCAATGATRITGRAVSRVVNLAIRELRANGENIPCG